MTIRYGIKVALSCIGIGWLLALLHTGATIDDGGGWYLVAALLAISGAVPEGMAWVAWVLAGAVCVHTLLWPDPDLYGLRWPHALVAFGLGWLLHYLALPSEVPVLRCRDCHYSGPRARFRSRRCPKCGSRYVQHAHQSVLTGA